MSSWSVRSRLTEVQSWSGMMAKVVAISASVLVAVVAAYGFFKDPELEAPVADSNVDAPDNSVNLSGQDKLNEDGIEFANVVGKKAEPNEVAEKIDEKKRRELIRELRGRAELDILQRERVYESAYDLCNGFLNGIYGSSAVDNADSSKSLPLECVEIRELLSNALGLSSQLEEKVLLIGILARWESMDRQLEFIRNYAQTEPVVSGADLAMLERNALYHANSVAEKQSVIGTFAALPLEEKADHAHEFFQTFSPLVLKDVQGGVTGYFDDLVAAADLFEAPVIPIAVDQAELSSLADSLPNFSSEEDFQLWAKENPIKFVELQNAVSSSRNGTRLTGSFSSVELALAVRGESPSPMRVVSQLEGEESDARVYHALSEICALKNESDHYYEYYREASNSSTLRSRIDGLRSSSELTEGQKKSADQLYLSYWSDY